MVSIETADNALKSFYLDAVSEALNYKANPLLAQIGQSTNNVVGKDVKKLLKNNNFGGVLGGSETGNLPKSQDGERIVLTATLKNLYGTIEISDKALRASASNEGAFVNLLNDEMQTLINSASYNFGRMLFGDGNGYLTKFTSEVGENSAVVDDATNLRIGMKVTLYDQFGSAIEGCENLEIIDVNRDRNEVYFNYSGVLSASIPSTVFVNLAGAHNYEITGLAKIFNQEMIYGVRKTTSTAMQPYIQEEVGDITSLKMQKALDDIERISGDGVNFIVCSWGVRRALMEHLTKNTTTVQSMEIAGGFKAISFNGIPVVADRFCPNGTMYLLNTNDFKIHQLCDWKWLEGEDGKILKRVPGKPVYTATLVKYAELMCDRPCGQGMLTGITEK